jgi:hypothetical protein
MIAMPQLQAGGQRPNLPAVRLRQMCQQTVIGQHHHAIAKLQTVIQIKAKRGKRGLTRLQLLRQCTLPVLGKSVTTAGLAGCANSGGGREGGLGRHGGSLNIP